MIAQPTRTKNVVAAHLQVKIENRVLLKVQFNNMLIRFGGNQRVLELAL